MIVVPFLPVDIVREDWYHILIGMLIKMVHFVPLVEDVGQYIRRRRVDYGGRDDVKHIPCVFVFWNFEFLVGVEPAYSREVNIASKYGDSDGFCLGNMLQFSNKPVSLVFVMLGCPVIIQVVENLNPTIKLVDEVAEHTSATKCFDGIHNTTGQYLLQEIQSWVSDWYTKKNDKMLGLPLDYLIFQAVKDDIVGVLCYNLVTPAFSSTV